MGSSWISSLVSTFGLPLAGWALVLTIAVHLYKIRNERLRDINNEKAGDWTRLREERDHYRAERDRFQELWMACEKDKDEELARRVKAEANEGVARQQAAKIVAQERLKGKGDKPEGGAR